MAQVVVEKEKRKECQLRKENWCVEGNLTGCLTVWIK